MDAEIALPIYAEILGRLRQRLENLEGCVFDSSCGTGHLLELYHQSFDAERALMGMDLSPKMVELARARVGHHAQIQEGDMRDMSPFAPGSMAAILSFFALHHLSPSDAQVAFQAWNQALQVGGQIVVAAWEGDGNIDYGDSSNVIALRYTKVDLEAWFGKTGFQVDRCWAEEIDGFDMKALYVEGTKR